MNSGPQAMVMISPISNEQNSPISFSLTNAHLTNTFVTDNDNDDVDDNEENRNKDDSNVKNDRVVLSSDTNAKRTAM